MKHACEIWKISERTSEKERERESREPRARIGQAQRQGKERKNAVQQRKAAEEAMKFAEKAKRKENLVLHTAYLYISCCKTFKNTFAVARAHTHTQRTSIFGVKMSVDSLNFTRSSLFVFFFLHSFFAFCWSIFVLLLVLFCNFVIVCSRSCFVSFHFFFHFVPSRAATEADWLLLLSYVR